MQSCIYTGHIRHRRFVPRGNEFRYAVFLVLFDLAERDSFSSLSPFWSVGSPNLAYLRRQDHFGDPAKSIDDSVRDLVRERSGMTPQGPIRMLCHFRYFGHCFNPATFYFCYNPEGTSVETVVIEVHNTPWGEVFLYVLDEGMNTGKGIWKHYAFDKQFHVSPFMGMDMHYEWGLREPGSALNIHMNSYRKGVKFFDATLTLSRHEASGSLLNRVLAEYPVITIKVLGMIYWQALKLLLKGIPLYGHPPRSGKASAP